jgi:Amt family ammonium transporter
MIGLDAFFSLNRRCIMKRWMVVVVLLLSIALVGVAIAEEAKVPLGSATETQNAPIAQGAQAPEAPLKIDPGDTAWLLISTALVMLMTPGLAFFYGGMVGRKNVL